MLRLRMDAELVKLKECGNPAEAALTRALLDANGIECLIGGEQIRAILGPIENSVVPVMVRARDLEQAQELLAGADAQPVDEAELTALAVAHAEQKKEVSMESDSEKPTDPRVAQRLREQREMLRFISGAVMVLLLIAWGLLKMTGTNAPLVLGLAVMALGVWVRTLLRNER
jgi:hypothetical protein